MWILVHQFFFSIHTDLAVFQIILLFVSFIIFYRLFFAYEDEENIVTCSLD